MLVPLLYHSLPCVLRPVVHLISGRPAPSGATPSDPGLVPTPAGRPPQRWSTARPEKVGTRAVEEAFRPHHVRPQAFAGERAQQLRTVLHRSPREFGKPSSLWILEWAAEVSFAQGLCPTRVSDETIRQTVKRLSVGWKRAKHWITSPDPEYVRKKGSATA